MGAWGAGSFENDDALDLLGELTPETCAEQLSEIFEAVAATGMQGELIEAPSGSNALAGAELIAAARGHPPDDLPAEAAPLVEALKNPPAELTEKAVSAVSYVLTANSELVELWAESDDPAEWNKVATGLVARLDAPARERKVPKKKRDQLTGAICSFCGEQITTMQLVELSIQRPWSTPGITQSIFAHESCLSSKLHPKYLVQLWTPPDLDV